jgi:hypothetical protein
MTEVQEFPGLGNFRPPVKFAISVKGGYCLIQPKIRYGSVHFRRTSTFLTTPV